MQIGQQIRCKKEGKIVICTVIDLMEEDISLDYNGERFTRKYWEVRPLKKND